MINKETLTTQTLINLYHEFFYRYSVDLANYFLDIVILKDISRRYWRDVERLHKFHDIEYIDCHKIAAYLTYWIAKLKPIHVSNNNVYLLNAETPMFINELFALYVAIGRINYHFKVNNINKSIKIDNKFIKSFIYTLKYRITTGDNLSLMYYFIEKN